MMRRVADGASRFADEICWATDAATPDATASESARTVTRTSPEAGTSSTVTAPESASPSGAPGTARLARFNTDGLCATSTAAGSPSATTEPKSELDELEDDGVASRLIRAS